MRIAAALFVIVLVFIEPSWASAISVA